jgi:adenylylsulfate kinase-like enzyme
MKKAVVWITGLPASGKTITANALKNLLKEKGHRVGTVDEDDVIRLSEKSTELGVMDQIKNNNIAVYSARNMFEFQGVEIVIVSTVSPLREMRDNAREIFTKYCKARFIEVYMDRPLGICEERDIKYQVPEFPEVIIHPRSTAYGKMTVDRAINIIYNRIQANTII